MKYLLNLVIDTGVKVITLFVELHESNIRFCIVDSSNGISSPDDNSGCEEYTENTLIENLDPPIIVPVPGKSGYVFLLFARQYS